MSSYTTKPGDVLDLLCYQRSAKIETILRNNPVLAEHDEQALPEGIVIEFPDDIQQQSVTKKTVNLWG